MVDRALELGVDGAAGQHVDQHAGYVLITLDNLARVARLRGSEKARYVNCEREAAVLLDPNAGREQGACFYSDSRSTEEEHEVEGFGRRLGAIADRHQQSSQDLRDGLAQRGVAGLQEALHSVPDAGVGEAVVAERRVDKAGPANLRGCAVEKRDFKIGHDSEERRVTVEGRRATFHSTRSSRVRVRTDDGHVHPASTFRPGWARKGYVLGH